MKKANIFMDFSIKNNIKNSIALLILAAVVLLLPACSSDDKKDEIKVFRQTVNLVADAWQKEVILQTLNAAIEEIKQDASWVFAMPADYTSGHPAIVLDFQENSGDERQTNIIITDKAASTVILTVKQVKPGDTPEPDPEPEPAPNYGADETHDVVTDQPASSRQR